MDKNENYENKDENKYCKGDNWGSDYNNRLINVKLHECQDECSKNSQCKGIIKRSNDDCVLCTSPNVEWVYDNAGSSYVKKNILDKAVDQNRNIRLKSNSNKYLKRTYDQCTNDNQEYKISLSEVKNHETEWKVIKKDSEYVFQTINDQPWNCVSSISQRN